MPGIADHEIVVFEAVVRSEIGGPLSGSTAAAVGEVPAAVPSAERRAAAAKALQKRGFTVRHIGTYSISAEGSRADWESTFGTEVEERVHELSPSHPEIGALRWLAPVKNAPFTIPDDLSALIESAYTQRPPILFVSPLPPRVGYHHLRVPDDVALVLRASLVHRKGVTGRGVLVAIVDTGLYAHPYHRWHGYSVQATPAPDAADAMDDLVGHGTAQSANVLACATEANVVGVKMGANLTLAFKAAMDLSPDIISLSWGVDVAGLTALPNDLKPLEAAVAEAIARGIIVCASAGNGQMAFPACMPDVIAVGGVVAHEKIADDDFDLEASDYASSFDSGIYLSRHVPDVAGLVGGQPRSIYIMLPVQPGSAMDVGLSAGGAFPNGDETASDDGWAVASGTSAAAPQVAGVCALLRQARPGASPRLIGSILKASARDVVVGKSSQGQPATAGLDGATGAGLVDAWAAYRLAARL